MNLAWILYYGRRLNMGRQEIMLTRYGEMRDMITCLQIEKGELLPVQKSVTKKWTYEEAMALE